MWLRATTKVQTARRSEDFFVGVQRTSTPGGDTPLRVTTTFTPSAPVRFQEVTFPTGVPVDHEYVFNSYRVSFLRRFAVGGRSELRLGLTGKVRDAKLALTSGAVTRAETNLGFVPLIYGGARLAPSSSLAIDLDIDAAAAP